MDQDLSKESDEPTPKRRKLDDNANDATNDKSKRRGMDKPISPPPLRRRKVGSPKQEMTESLERERESDTQLETNAQSMVESSKQKVVKSPFQLTSIRDLPASSNLDTASLKDILGDPLISECWEFNYLHDLDFLMEQFDEDIRNLVKVNVIHGFWRREDQSRRNLMEQALKYPNINLLTAYMPEMFGTHHSKVDNLSLKSRLKWDQEESSNWIFLITYELMTQKRIICKPLVEQLSKHDFSSIRAAIVASAPGKQNIELESSKTAWGWAGLTEVLKSVPCTLSTSKSATTSKPIFKIIFPTADEVRRSLNGYSSGSAIHTKILTPAQGKQLTYLKPILCHWAGDGPQHKRSSPKLPEADLSLNLNKNSQPQQRNQNAHRKRAAPHIKTYIRFSSSSFESIDWILVTSANLSKQAWGENTNAAGEVRICSYEIGVLAWPSLWGEEASMVPCFGTDTPRAALESKTVCEGKETNDSGKRGDEETRNEGNTRQDEGTLVGVRMPYDLPIIPYAKNDTPWCATASYTEPDWMGQTWNT
ncbi:hypothetical protein EYC84_003792 [Monilinia fructicola]|uniref:Tyrosyl-DNA phosphodiesterase n=1 Tax=Monilinia fructicola TaxID=38448 RepID=A0A5M9JUV5_MONFR|nr:hypothetical protein EYC84_003792 [Monilinia fructicola]